MSDPAFYAGMTLPAGELQDLGEFGTWTPTLTATTTNPTMGSGAVTDGEYHRNGRLITIFFNITFGTSGVAAGTGNYQIDSLPFPIDTLVTPMGAGGIVQAEDTSAASRYVFSVQIQSTTVFQMRQLNSPSSVVTAAAPFTWAANDYLRGTITYLGTT